MPRARFGLDERLAKALSHRLRVRILERLSEHGVGSPSALADALGEPLGNISYHVRILRELDCVELVRTEPRRGALEHFYRATVSPWISDEQWADLPATFRRTTLARTFSEILAAAAQASRQGASTGPRPMSAACRSHSTTRARPRSPPCWPRRATPPAHPRRERQPPAKRDAGAPPPIPTELALMHLRRADAN